jgi:diacylglycerol kinase
MNYFRKRFNSFRFAIKGLKTMASTQPNFVIHLIAGFFAIAAAFYFRLSPTEWIALFIVITLVLLTEIINTAIEFVVDLVSPDFHPLAGKIKDISAAAVVLAVLLSLIAGAIIFLPKIIA